MSQYNGVSSQVALAAVIKAVRVEFFVARVLYRVSYRVLEYRLIPDVTNLM